MSTGNKMFKIEIAPVSGKAKGEPAHSIVLIASAVWRFCLVLVLSGVILGCRGRKGKKDERFQ